MTDHTPSGLPQPQTVAGDLAAMLARYIEHYDAKPSMEYIRLRRDEAERILAALSAPAVETVAVQEATLRDHYDAILTEIGDFAHDHSTGPAVPDALWEVRSMAYSAVGGPPPASPAEQAATQAEAKGIPTEDGIRWQSGNTWPNERKAVTVDGHAWYRHDHPSVNAAPTAPTGAQAEPGKGEGS